MGATEADNTIHIGKRTLWDRIVPFGLRTPDRRQHLYTVGKTGAGKTMLLRNLFLQDIEAGRGAGIIDPHGDLVAELLEHIPPHRTDDVVYFNPADYEHPICFNLLANVSPERRDLAASNIVSAFKSVWRDSWGPRLEYILYATVAALLECSNVSLLGVQRMLVDDRYRAWVLKQVTDPMVRSFWLDEFERYDKHFRQEAIAPIQNKVGRLLMAPPIRNILGQVKSKVDPAFMMDDRRILIADLSKGSLGEEKANLMGAILVTAFQLAAMERTKIPEEERTDFFLYIDEFPNFTTEAFTSILAEARKYRLCLTLAHQYIDQLPNTIRDAVFGNVGSLLSFRVGTADAQVLEREFGHSYAASAFAELANREVCAKLLSQGEHTEPFFGTTLQPLGHRYGRGRNIIERSREKYSRPKREVEEKIARWMAR